MAALETVADVKMDFEKSRLLDESIKINSRQKNKEPESNEVTFKTTTKGSYICKNKSYFQAQCPRRFEDQRGRGNFRGMLFQGTKRKQATQQICH